MATRQVLKEEFLTCIICHEVFRDPVTLHCGHTLCAQCVTEYTKTQKDALTAGCIACPHCRGFTKVPDAKKPVDEWTGQLKTGFFVQGLVEKFALDRQEDGDTCNLCKEEGETNPAAFWCSDCGHALCLECQKVHGKLHKNHDVSNITGESDKPVIRKPKRAVCQKHPDFVIDLFCEDCDLAICQRCSTLQHRKCESVILLEDALSKINPVLEDLKKQIDKKVAVEQREVSDLTSQVDKINSSAVKAEAEINKATGKLVSKIHEKQKHLVGELTQRKQKALQRLATDINSRVVRMEMSKQRQSFLQHAVESRDANTRYEAYTQLSKNPTESGEQKSHLGYNETLEFEDKTETVLNFLTQVNFGKLKGRAPGSSPVPRINIRLVRKLDTKAINISGITLMYPKGLRTIVAAYTLAECIKSFSVKDGLITSEEDTLHLGNEAYSVAKISDTRAATSLYVKKQILFFTVDPKLRIEKKVQTQRSYLGLAYLNSTTFGALTHVPRCVDIIDMSGGILTTFGSDILITKGVGHIASVCDKRLFVSDTLNHKSILFDSQGKVQFTYNHRPKCPAGLCSGNTGELFVVDENKVCQLSEGGEFVRDVVTKIEGLTARSALYYDKKCIYLSVCDQYVYIYQILS